MTAIRSVPSLRFRLDYFKVASLTATRSGKWDYEIENSSVLNQLLARKLPEQNNENPLSMHHLPTDKGTLLLR